MVAFEGENKRFWLRAYLNILEACSCTHVIWIIRHIFLKWSQGVYSRKQEGYEMKPAFFIQQLGTFGLKANKKRRSADKHHIMEEWRLLSTLQASEAPSTEEAFFESLLSHFPKEVRPK